MTDQDSDLGKNLTARFPWLAGQKFTWGWECGAGWEEILAKFLAVVERECPDGKGFQILQVKEKFGTLRFYYQLHCVEQDAANRIHEAETLLDARSLHTSAAFAPASCSRRTPMICSSVNRFRFICPSFDQGPDSNSRWRKNSVACMDGLRMARAFSARLAAGRVQACIRPLIAARSCRWP